MDSAVSACGSRTPVPVLPRALTGQDTADPIPQDPQSAIRGVLHVPGPCGLNQPAGVDTTVMIDIWIQ